MLLWKLPCIDCQVSVIIYHMINFHSFLCLGKPSQLFEKDDSDRAPTKKMGHKNLTVTPELASYCHKRREKRAQQKRNLDAAEALVTLQKSKSVHRELLPSTSETTEIEDQALSDSINSDLTTDCPLLNLSESSVLNETIHEDQEPASNSFDMNLQTDLTADMITSLDSELNELNSKLYQLREENKAKSWN